MTAGAVRRGGTAARRSPGRRQSTRAADARSRTPRPGDLPTDRAPRVLRQFPVTTLLLIPYAVLILPQALLFGNPDTGFIVLVLGLALVPTFVVELLIRRPSPGPLIMGGPTYGRSLYRVAVVVGVIGALSTLLRAQAGVVSVFAQVGQIAAGSVMTTALSVLTPWSAIGAGLIAAAHLAGQCTRRRAFLWIGVLLCGEAAAAYYNAITAPFFAYVIFVVTLLLYLGIIGVRHCLGAAGVVLVAWPTVFTLRNEARLAGGVDVSSRIGAFDRLRYDLQITRAADLGHSIDVATPGVMDVLRFGLVPRFLDPGRPSLSTGSAINVYLGGSAESSFTFLPVTTTYVLDGPWALAGVYVTWALVMFLLLRNGTRLTPLRTAVLALVLAGPLGWFASYPDSSVGLLQGVVSLIPVAVALRFVRALELRGRTSDTRRAGRSLPPLRRLDAPSTATGAGPG